MHVLSEAQDAGMTTAGSYIHWHNERSPYAVELKAGLIGQIIEEIAAAGDLGAETGGVLVGTFPRATELTVRIERIIPIKRTVEDGAEFVSTNAQRERFRAAVRDANTRETSAVGFFRSRRGVPLALSDEDRRLSTEEFKNSIHVILLVGAALPRSASIYFSTGLQSPPEIVVPEFSFSLDALTSAATMHSSALTVQPLPATPPPSAATMHPSVALTTVSEEVAPRTVGFPAEQPPMWQESRPKRWGVFTVLAVFLMLGAFAAGFIVRPLLPGSKLESELPRSEAELDFGVEGGPDKVLQISWNHQAPVIYKANYGVLAITDGLQTRRIKLSRDELATGSVSYERVNDSLSITLMLNMPDGTTVSQSCSWPAK
jgi:proteasome lid subunit RPN8/RPN11